MLSVDFQLCWGSAPLAPHYSRVSDAVVNFMTMYAAKIQEFLFQNKDRE